jgi:hypothetical protein
MPILSREQSGGPAEYGRILGQGAGNSISSGINALLEAKTNELNAARENKQIASGLQALRYSPQESSMLAPLAKSNPKIFEHLVKQKLAEPGNEAYARALGLESGLEQPSIDQQPSQSSMYDQIQPEQKQQLLEFINNPANQEQLKQLAPDKLEKVKQSLSVPVKNIVKQPQLTAQQATEIAKIRAAKTKESAREVAEAQKETKVYYDKILESEREAEKADDRLDRMMKLVEENKLPPAALHRFLENLTPSSGTAIGGAIGGAVGGVVGRNAGSALGSVAAGPLGTIAGNVLGKLAGPSLGAIVGGGIGALAGSLAPFAQSLERAYYPGTEEFEKLSNQFISGAKAIFGSRVTDADLKAFMAQVPTLSNSDEGKKVIIRSLKAANEAEHARAKAMKEIIKENGGKRPADLPLLVEERARKRIDKLADEFESNLEKASNKKEIPVQQNYVNFLPY